MTPFILYLQSMWPTMKYFKYKRSLYISLSENLIKADQCISSPSGIVTGDLEP